MAIARIKCLRVIGLKEQLFDAAEALVAAQCFEPDDPLSFHSDIKMFAPVAAQNPYSEVIESFRAAVASADIRCSAVSVSGRKFTDETLEKVKQTVDSINGFSDRRIRLEDDIALREGH